MLMRQPRKANEKQPGVKLLVIKEEVWLQCDRCGARWKPFSNSERRNTQGHSHCPYGCSS